MLTEKIIIEQELKKWGGSVALMISGPIKKFSGMSGGDLVHVEVSKGRIVVTALIEETEKAA